MGQYTGTNSGDLITGFLDLSPGVVSVPAGSKPSDANDSLNGLGGDDTLQGEGGNDDIHGGEGNDTLYGGDGNDFLAGDQGNDLLEGENGADTLHGGPGDDSIDGGGGDDIELKGQGGKDELDGGEGKDKFAYDSVDDSPFGPGRDIIHNYQLHTDNIDLSTIDANVDQSGNQEFMFMGTHGITGPGQVNLIDEPDPSGHTIVQLNTDSDLQPEAQIEIDDLTIASSDYMNSDFIL